MKGDCQLGEQTENATNMSHSCLWHGCNETQNYFHLHHEEMGWWICRLQAFVTVASLTLRSPANARKAVEAGAVDMAALIMAKYPCAAHLQRQGCQMLRNLAVRNPENRQVISLSLSLSLSISLELFFQYVIHRGSFNTCLWKNQLKGFHFTDPLKYSRPEWVYFVQRRRRRKRRRSWFFLTYVMVMCISILCTGRLWLRRSCQIWSGRRSLRITSVTMLELLLFVTWDLMTICRLSFIPHV